MHATDNHAATPDYAGQQPTEQEINHLIVLHEQGEHAQLESATLALLERHANSAFVWSVLAIALQLQDKDALPALQNTVNLAPDDAQAHLHLANARLAHGQADLAVAAYVRALEIEPALGDALCGLGDALQAQGHSAEAAQCYRGALELDATHAAAHMGLADTQRMQRQFKAAENSYQQALKLVPGAAEILRRLGDLYMAMSRHEQAIRSYGEAVQADPANALAHGGLGDALFKLGRHEGAAASYGAAVQHGTGHAAHYHGLGRSLHAIGQNADAEAAYRQAITLDPSVSAPLLHYADLLRETRRKDQAIAIYQAARLLEPSNTDTLNNLAMALQEAGQLEQALDYYEQVALLAPKSPIPHCNMAAVLQALGRSSASIQSCKRAIKLSPEYAGAHFNLGTCLMETGQLDDAVKSYERAIKLDPQSRQAHVNLSATLGRLGRIEQAITHARLTLKLNPDWDELHSNLLFYLTHSQSIDAKALFAEHLRYGQQCEAPHRASLPQHNNVRDPERRLRIGFVSADLYNHAVANFITPVLEHLAHAPQFELVAYANSKHDDDISRHLRSLVHAWRQVELLSHEELAQLITSDGVDILIDLSGHTGHNRLPAFARKPAPLQVSWIGYPGTTGLQAMDYYLSDRYYTPPGMLDGQFTEKLLCLPACAPFMPSSNAPPISAAPGIKHGYITFGSFNRPSKLSREVIARWAKVLHAVPSARMLLAGMPNKQNSDMLRSWFVREGIAAERLSFHAHTNIRDYLALHAQVDVCLDTFPYTSGTTGFHALWMGVPTLTTAGSALPGRVTATILAQAGLSEFITHNEDEFIEKARLLAGDIARLDQLRLSMRERMQNSASGQPLLISKGLEVALRGIWQRWCAALPASACAVNDAMEIEFDRGSTQYGAHHAGVSP